MPGMAITRIRTSATSPAALGTTDSSAALGCVVPWYTSGA